MWLNVFGFLLSVERWKESEQISPCQAPQVVLKEIQLQMQTIPLLALLADQALEFISELKNLTFRQTY